MAGFESAPNIPSKKRSEELNQQNIAEVPGADLNGVQTPTEVENETAAQAKAFKDENSYRPDLGEHSSRNERRNSGSLTRADKRADNENTPNFAPKTGEPDPNKFGGTPFGKHVGAGGLKGAAASGGNKFANYIKRHPKGMIWGAVSLVGIIMSIVVAMLSIPFQLIHMAKILLDHNFAPGNKIEQTASRRVIARLFQEKATETGGAKKTTGRPIADKMANLKMDKFNKMLAADNLKLNFDSAGRLTGISNIRTKEVMTNFSESSFLERRTAIGDLVSERIAPWRVLKRVSYTEVMRYHARVSFKFWPAEKVTDIKKLFADKIRNGASADELLADRSAAVQDPSKPGGSDANGAVQAAKDNFAATGSKTSAIRAGTAKFMFDNAKVLGITGIIAGICSLQQMANDAANTGYIDRTMQLIRNGNVLFTQMAQLYTGHGLDMNKLGQTMAQFNGDSTASKDSLDRKGWDQSAAAQRITGQPVDTQETLASGKANPNFTPDLSEASNPDGFMLQKVVDHVNALFSFIPGVNLVCAAVTSVAGVIFGGIEFIAEAISTAGVGDAVVLALKTAAMLALQLVVIPKVLAAAANLAITGTENSVDFFNNADAGALLSAQDYQRSYGGRQISDNEQIALVDESKQEQIQVAQAKGWFYRILDLNNIHSVASNVLMKVPTSTYSAVAALTNMPTRFTASLGVIFFGSFRPAYAATPASINPYKFQFYGFTQAEIDKYPDPIANEEYLAAQVPGQPAPADGGKTRLSVLGNSSTYTPADGDDPNTADLMHCFVNKFRAPADLQTDPICSNIGLVTARGGSVATTNGDEIVREIYKTAGLNASVNDDFLRYRMQLMYTHITRGVECASTDEDCFKSTGAGGGATLTTAPNGGPIDMANLFADSTSIACSSGTKDLGIQDGYHSGTLVKIRICAVSNLPGSGQESHNGFGVTGAGGATVVNSRVSGQVFAMAAAMKQAGLNITTSSAFRTMANQQSLCPCDGVSVAVPGTSNHQMGLAMDFGANLPSSPGPIAGNLLWDWLSKNASQFGYSNYPREAWHWSPTGN